MIVTGTDTDVGKTFITTALARLYHARGARVVAIKPFESGAGDGAGDGERLAAATGQREPRRALVRLRDPLAPAMAADREQITLDLEATCARIIEHGRDADIVLVEGAGGVLSPLTWTADITTLARMLDSNALVLVASDRLGTLSATHCAVQTLYATWIVPSAIVLSAPLVPDLSTGANAGALRRRLAGFGRCAERIVEMPRCRDDEAAAHLDAIVTWLG